MPYDFTTLSPDDFERLVGDLFSAEWGKQLEIFKAGPDGGIDLRHSRVLSGEPRVIIQCKRYAPKSFTELKRSAKSEARKLTSIKPERYILATSVELSPENKRVLMEVLWPFIKDESDIYGADELNRMLVRHRSVERAHFKLWISSTTILERVLHAGIFNVTEATVEAVKQQMSRLVVHDAYDRALDTLEQQHHCVIAGNPGIGKTTLARMLMCHYLNEGFVPLVIIGDIAEAWSAVTRACSGSEKYVAFYDDFLGTFRFDAEKFSKNEDASLMRFVETAKRTRNLRLILTTREYIMADAKRLHGTFSQHADQLASCTILLGDYARAIRARVLFNHLYFSDLPEPRLRAIVSSSVYRDIVDHEHFNPRVVEAICVHANSAALTDAGFINYVRRRFDDPSELWRHPFEHQISPTARQVVVLLWSFGGTAEYEVLKSAVVPLSGESDPAAVAMQFRAAMRELTGNFVTSNRYQQAYRSDDAVHVITFQNPSVHEFVDRFLRTERAWLERLAEFVQYFVQVRRLVGWAEQSGAPYADRDVVGARFWALLHKRAAVAEGNQAGRLTRSMGAVVYSPRDGVRSIERTYILLRILKHFPDRDDRAKAVERRVTTLEGWRELLTDVALQSTVADFAAAIVELVTSFTPVRVNLYRVRRTFGEVTLRLLQKEPFWPAGLSSLCRIVESLQRLQPHVPTSAKYVAAVHHVVDETVDQLLEHETNVQVLYEASSALRLLAALGNFSSVDMADAVQARAQELSDSHGDEPDDSPARHQSRQSVAGDLDIDSLFRDLVDS